MLATVVFPIRNNKVLLAKKTRKIGMGKWNGFGGKLEGEESIRQCACRELFEETGSGIVALPDDLTFRAHVDFFLHDTTTESPDWSVDFFTIEQFSGEATSADGMADPTWFPLDAVPYENMLSADMHFVPRILDFDVEPFSAVVRYDENMGVESVK